MFKRFLRSPKPHSTSVLVTNDSKFRSIATLFLVLAAAFVGLGTGHMGERVSQAKNGTPPKAPISHPLQKNIECVGCHQDTISKIWKSPHGRISMLNPKQSENGYCETCHINTDGHKDDQYDVSIPFRFSATSPQNTEAKNQVCLSCHEKEKHLKSWFMGRHAEKQVACVDCHTVHHKGEPGSKQLAKSETEICGTCHQNVIHDISLPHAKPIKSGQMACSTCHNPHGTPNDKMLLASTKTEACTTCHQEKKGPFVHNHPPVQENCMNCHTPHGSVNDNLLSAKVPMLCLQCHTPPSTSHQAFILPDAQGNLNPTGGNLNAANAKGCMNCHSTIHGSNHPGGYRFQR